MQASFRVTTVGDTDHPRDYVLSTLAQLRNGFPGGEGKGIPQRHATVVPISIRGKDFGEMENTVVHSTISDLGKLGTLHQR